MADIADNKAALAYLLEQVELFCTGHHVEASDDHGEPWICHPAVLRPC